MSPLLKSRHEQEAITRKILDPSLQHFRVEQLLPPANVRRAKLRERLREAKRDLHPYRTLFSFPFGKNGGGKLSVELDLSREDFLAFHNGTLPRKTVTQIFRDAERAIMPLVREQWQASKRKKEL